MTVKFSPAELSELIREALRARNLRVLHDPKFVIKHESRGDVREPWTEAVFDGVSCDVTEDFELGSK